MRDFYAEMVTVGTRYGESTVFKTMQRMKTSPKRPSVIQLDGWTGKASEYLTAAQREKSDSFRT